MAWNPSPEVQVARDAAASLSTIKNIKVDRCVVLFTTETGKCGFVSYGSTKEKCAEAGRIADLSYKAAFTEDS